MAPTSLNWKTGNSHETQNLEASAAAAAAIALAAIVFLKVAGYKCQNEMTDIEKDGCSWNYVAAAAAAAAAAAKGASIINWH